MDTKNDVAWELISQELDEIIKLKLDDEETNELISDIENKLTGFVTARINLSNVIFNKKNKWKNKNTG